MMIDGEVVAPLSRVWMHGASSTTRTGSDVLARWQERETPEDIARNERELGFPRPILVDEHGDVWGLPPLSYPNDGAAGLYDVIGASDVPSVSMTVAACGQSHRPPCTFELRVRRQPLAYDGYLDDYWGARPDDWVHATMSLPSWDELQEWSGGQWTTELATPDNPIWTAATRYLYVGFDGEDVTIEMRATNGAEPIRARIHDR